MRKRKPEATNLSFFKKNNSKPEQEAPKLNWRQSLIIDLKDVLCVLAVFMVVYMLFFRVVVVVGPSMNDTLVDGDRLVLLSSLVYTQPKQGDVIVASKESFGGGDCIIKRVIATEGQTVDIDFEHGIVYVDGIALEEEYVSSPTTRPEGTIFPLTVEEGHVFVMGDNRDNSKDSRDPSIGLVDVREILGKAIFILMPGNNRDTESTDYSRIGVID